MPILQNAKKALRVSMRKAEINQRSRSRMKTGIVQVTKTPTAENASTAYSMIDRAVKRNLIHKNKAARLKSQVAKRVATAA